MSFVSRSVFLSLGVACIVPLEAQRGRGELRLSVTDPGGLGLEAAVELAGEATGVRQSFRTGSDGRATAKPLPFGFYRLRVERAGMAVYTAPVEIRSEVPLDHHAALGLAVLETTLVVREADRLVDPAGAAHYVGSERLREQRSATPGRAVLELINAQPGWLLEANGVLHPRGSEYNTQYVIDGIPITDNRSPTFAPALDADDVQSMNVFTANIPAEFGRKLGGVVEVNSARDPSPGFRGKLAVDGGSFGQQAAHLSGERRWRRTSVSLAAQAMRTRRFLDPPVEKNLTNAASGGGSTARLERDFTDRDRVSFYLHAKRTGFLVPNEIFQEAAGQRQDRATGETMGQFSYHRTLGAAALLHARGMARDGSAELWSNPSSTPIGASQDRGVREGYWAASVAAHRGGHELKSGAELVFSRLRERFHYRLTDRDFFDDDVPLEFRFAERASGHEQALYVQDLLRAGPWTFSLGLRWDRYSLRIADHALSPRLGAAWHLAPAGLVLRASYDRAFETPAIEGLLLASSGETRRLTAQTSGLPIRPARSHFYQAGFAKSLWGKARLDANWFRRRTRNFADDSLLLNTGISFPITFARAAVDGIEAKLELPPWGRFSGYLSYGNLSGTGWLPLTGGLFIDAAAAALLRSTASFPITQDQRHTARARLRCQLSSRLWVAGSASYGSGLPIEREGDQDREALEKRFGLAILDRVDFERGRVRPNFSMDLGAGAVLWRAEEQRVTVQADGWNMTARLNVINFAGLFSGTALAPPRSASLRLVWEF